MEADWKLWLGRTTIATIMFVGAFAIYNTTQECKQKCCLPPTVIKCSGHVAKCDREHKDDITFYGGGLHNRFLYNPPSNDFCIVWDAGGVPEFLTDADCDGIPDENEAR